MQDMNRRGWFGRLTEVLGGSLVGMHLADVLKWAFPSLVFGKAPPLEPCREAGTCATCGGKQNWRREDWPRDFVPQGPDHVPAGFCNGLCGPRGLAAGVPHPSAALGQELLVVYAEAQAEIEQHILSRFVANPARTLVVSQARECVATLLLGVCQQLPLTAFKLRSQTWVAGPCPDDAYVVLHVTCNFRCREMPGVFGSLSGTRAMPAPPGLQRVIEYFDESPSGGGTISGAVGNTAAAARIAFPKDG